MGGRKGDNNAAVKKLTKTHPYKRRHLDKIYKKGKKAALVYVFLLPSKGINKEGRGGKVH